MLVDLEHTTSLSSTYYTTTVILTPGPGYFLVLASQLTDENMVCRYSITGTRSKTLMLLHHERIVVQV